MRRTLPPLLVVTLLAVIAWSGIRANAAWHYRTAATIANSVVVSGEVTQSGINQAESHLGRALEWFPQHPAYLELAGNMQEIQAGQPGVVGKTHRKALEQAAAYYRRSLAVRPLWPHGWANLLAVKDRLGQQDDEFTLALTRSAVTGPWTPRVQRQVLESGIRHWDQLASTERELVRGKVADALQIQPRVVFEIVRGRGRPDLVCDAEINHPRIKRWCDLVYFTAEEVG